jgi:ankyrin repeat protein
MSANACDKHGNTAVHQAAASGSDEVVKCFLSRGVDVTKCNAREHTPLHLATKDTTRNLIMKALDAKKCIGNNCNGSVFDF